MRGLFRLGINMIFDYGGDDGFPVCCNYRVAKKPMACEAGGSIGFAISFSPDYWRWVHERRVRAPT